MHHYLTANDTLPPAGGIDILGNSTGSGRVPQTASIHLRLLNYLEQRAVYDAYNFMLGDVVNGVSVPANTTVMATSIQGYLCPSDPNPGSIENLAGGFNARVTCVNYTVNGGTNRQYQQGGSVNGVAWWLGGNATYGRPADLAGMTDGTSNTAAASEWVKGTNGANVPGTNLVYTIGQYTNGSPQNDVATCAAASAVAWDGKGEYWTLQDTGRGGPYYHVIPPNGRSCMVTSAFGNVDSFIGSSSFHPGGANVLRMDGSVRFVKNSVALSIWNALGTRAGGEVLNDGAF
jgi:prepilin-type processing-associated H-X9-DG protein